LNKNSAAERLEAVRTIDEGCSRAMAVCVDIIAAAAAAAFEDIYNIDSSTPAGIFIESGFVDVLESAPPADVVHKHLGELALRAINVQ